MHISKEAILQFVKFAAVGILSFAIDWGGMVLLVEYFGLDYMVGTTISFLTSVVVNYILSMHYVFDHRGDMSLGREFTIFAILSCIGLGLNDLFMFVGVAMLNVAYQLMKVIATFCVTWYNFFSRKRFLTTPIQ